MSLKCDLSCFGAGLVLSSVLCLAQAASDTQQQIAEHTRKIQQYLQEKKPDLAIPELQALVALDPDNADAHGNLGVLLFFKGNCADAVPQLRSAINLKQGLWRIEVLLSVCEKRQGDVAGARTDLENAFPHLEDEKLRLEAGMELIDIYSTTGDLGKAAGVVTVLREHNPTDVGILYTAYRIYSDLAGEAMISLSLVDPESAQMQQVIAHEELKQGNTNGAIDHSRKAIAINPRLPGIHFDLAEMLNTLQDPNAKKQAEQEYRVSLAQNPEDEKTLMRLAEIDAQEGKSQQSFEEFSKAVQLQPSDSDAKLGLAKALIDMNQTDKALALLEETVKQEPTNSVAHFRLATLYRKMGRVDDAKNEVELYKKYKDMKEKLRGMYKELQIQPKETHLDEQNEK